MEKMLVFTDQCRENTLKVCVGADSVIINDSGLIFEAIEMLLGFVKQRDYENTDDYNDKLHGVINLCREKIYEDSEGAENGRM